MSSPFVQWLQNLADGIQHNHFLDYQVNTGLFGIPVATFGLVTIAAAVFVHATFSDEISAIGTQVYEATEQGLNRATEMAETAQIAVSEEANRISESVSSTLSKTPSEPETQTTPSELPPKQGGAVKHRRRRKTSRKKNIN